MQSLALPRPTSLLSTPFGRPSEPEDGLAKFRSKFSPTRPDEQSYPSPPMSEPHSPSRRLAQTVEAGRLSYPPSAAAAQRSEPGLPLPPPSSSLFDPRSALTAQGNSQQRPLYPGELQHRGQPLHYQPGRAHEHASYGSVPLPQNYHSYGYSNAGVPPYPGAQHAGSMVQQAAMIPPPAARPTKPARRTKAHVASACVNCKKAHLSCDVQRPCGRCVASGKQDTCKDVQHKKRGRPRLRDDREFTRPEEGRQPAGQILGALPAPDSFAHQAPFLVSHPHRVSDTPRIMGTPAPTLDTSTANHPIHYPSNGGPSGESSGYGATSASSYGSGSGYQSLPVAFLNIDLVIQKSNQAFQDLVAFLGDVRGKHLGEFLEARQKENLQHLRNELRDERDEREPTYMAPITPIGQDPMRAVMDSVAEQDVEQVSHAFTDRPMFLSFRLPTGQYQSLQVQIRLAKTSLYFVTLVVRSPPRLTAPLLTQQLAPPTPMRASQTMSAPAIGPVSQFTPTQARPPSSTSSAPSSPYFNFSSVRTSLPTFSPSSYGSSPSYGYSPTAGGESGYFPTIQPPPQPGAAYPSPYASVPRQQAATSEPLRDLTRPAHLEGLHLPPIRTGPVPLGSPVHLDSGSQSAGQRDSERLRQHDSPASNDQRRPETPETGKRRRLNIHEVLE